MMRDRDIKAKDETRGEYIRRSLTNISRMQELEKKIGEVLKKTLEGLEKLQNFVDAVEKLAVTSLSIFMGESFMPKEMMSMFMCSLISAARVVSPLLIHFKRDAEAFFFPSLSNVEVLDFRLKNYIIITQQICKKMEIVY